MPRITCKTPSSGKPVQLRLDPPYVMPIQTWVTIAEAPDFSVPDPTNTIPARDPADATRAIRPGEVFFLTPLIVNNNNIVQAVVTLVLTAEGSGALTNVIGRFVIPPRDAVMVPIQGRSILKRNPAASEGERLMILVEGSGGPPLPPSGVSFWGSAEERVAADHVGVV